MPRTSRRTATSGLLWEALAPAVRWPLHSPGRLALIVAAGVLLAWALAALRSPAAAVPGEPGPLSAGTVAPVTVATPGVARPASPTDAPAGSGSASPASNAAAQAAVGFVTAWARPDLTAQPWQQGVMAWATPEFAAQLLTVLPAKVPARSVSGPATVTNLSDLAASVTVPTDAGLVRVDLATVGQAWKVTGVIPAGAQPARTTGAGSSISATYSPLPTRG